nr:hypothetical protein [Treponema sp.]
VYIPFNSKGDDHIEDFLGMTGIPMEPVCEFPELKGAADSAVKLGEFGPENSVLVTESSLTDTKIIEKLCAFVKAGGHAIATSRFIIGALQKYPEITELTGVSYTGRHLAADEFQTPGEIAHFKNYAKSSAAIEFPLLEHRNNSTWSVMNAGHGEYHESILCYDTYGKGRFSILKLPDMPSRIYDLPAPALTAIRKELDVSGIWIDAGSGVSIFTYDNKTFGVYCYAWDGCAPQEFNIHIRGKVKVLERIPDGSAPSPWKPNSILPLYTKNTLPGTGGTGAAATCETVFYGRATPGEFDFFKIIFEE